MSLQFSKTDSPYNGIIQQAELEIGGEDFLGQISGNAKRLGIATTQANLALDDYVYLALKSSGTWQWDDSNFTDYPIIKTNLVSGQRDYTFITDEGGNLILDIYKVMILPSATATIFEEIRPIDQQQIDSFEVDDDIAQEVSTQGVPYRYDKTANGIFLDPIPSYNATNGLKVFINREASRFTTSDTTKKPGCPGIHHRYFALKIALDYARRNNLVNYNLIREEVVSYEGDEEKGITGSIERYFSRRSKDERPVYQPEFLDYE